MRSKSGHYHLLAHLLKELVSDRFKRMAKDEVLSKFISSRVDPALLVDHSLQAERESLDLAEMSLLKLIDSSRLDLEIEKSAQKIQKNLELLFGEDVSNEFSSDNLIQVRADWVRARVHFYRKWLSLLEPAESPIDLARKAFRSSKNFEAVLESLFTADKNLADEQVKLTHSLYRFLMRKQMDYELKHSQDLWEEFKSETFKKTAELP